MLNFKLDTYSIHSYLCKNKLVLFAEINFFSSSSLFKPFKRTDYNKTKQKITIIRIFTTTTKIIII